jgi:RNA 2',3'-cyclic 3'-phosphodiesterase
MPRLFVAIDIPVELKLKLSQLCTGVPSVRWVVPENFHLTLRFIGEVDDATATSVVGALRRVQMPRFRLTLAGVGQFGGHTLWVGAEPDPALLRLHSAVEKELQGVAPAADARPYLPHVKLAHSRRRRSFRAFLLEHAGFRAEPFEVADFSLIESHPDKTGSVYDRRANYALLAAGEAAPSRIGSPAPAQGGIPVLRAVPAGWRG